LSEADTPSKNLLRIQVIYAKVYNGSVASPIELTVLWATLLFQEQSASKSLIS